MLVCSKCGFSQIVTHRCPQCHEAWMEEKSTSHNKDYAAAQEIWCDYKESNMDVQYPFFDDYCKMRLNSQK